ncbi:MAG TPA: hypothetical protein VF347_02585 [Candidatus Humimicrobiaceae bacterium]
MKSLSSEKKTGNPGRSDRHGNPGRSGIKSVKKLYNPLLKIIVLLLIFILSFSALLLISGCKKQAASETTMAAASVSASTVAESTASAITSASTTAATESATESTEAIPSDTTTLIKKSDGYYSSGQYGLSKSTYRKATIAIDASDLSDGAKQELKDSFNDKYNKSQTIVATALVHFGNAMQLEYETRYEEAKKELEAALAIYPKYEDAIEAYDNLKSIMGLK